MCIAKKGSNMAALIAPKQTLFVVCVSENRGKYEIRTRWWIQMTRSGCFGVTGSWKVVGRGWLLEKKYVWKFNLRQGCHLQTRLLVCSQSDKVRLCCLALMKTSNFLFFFSLSGNPTQIEQLYIKPVYSPLFLLKCNLLPTVIGGRIDCALCLILCFSCHCEVRDQNRDGTQQWQWSASTYQKLQNTAQCHTHSVIQLTQFSYALVANTVTA